MAQARDLSSMYAPMFGLRACLNFFGQGSTTPLAKKMGPVRIRHSSHDFGWQSSHSVDLAGWQAKMASIEIWIP